MRHVSKLGLLLLGLHAQLLAQNEQGLLLYVPFDKFQVDAAVAKGDPTSSFKESIELRNYPGVKGGALMLKDGERCEYDLGGNFNPQQGTMSLWFKAVNWDGSDRLFHHFLCISDKKTPTVWYVYKYTYPRHLNFYVARGAGKQEVRVYCGTSMEKWQRDEWHHVAVTWNAEEMRLYADGKPQGRQRVPEGFFPQDVEGVLSVAPVHYWRNKWSSPEARTLVDGVRVYDRVLSDREVLEMFEALNPYAEEGQRKPTLTAAIKPDVVGRKLKVSLAAMHLDEHWEQALRANAKVTVTVTVPEGGKCVQGITLARDMEVDVPVPAWPDGEYKAVVTAKHEDRTLSAEAVLRKPATPWLDRKPGSRFLDSVLPPYTPLERTDRVVNCWGRTVELGSGPFPVAMQSQGVGLLRGPMVLRGRMNGADFVVTGDTTVASVADHRVAFSGSQELGPASVAWQGYMEFDGMVRSDVKITPKASATIERLEIDLPLSPGFMRYVRTPRRRDWVKDRFQSAFLNYLWVGDESRGLCWFMESDANFHNRPDSTVIALSRSTGDASITVVNDPAAFDKPLTYTLGLQATPLKPLPKGWQGWRLAHSGFKHVNMMTHGWGPSCYTLAGSLFPCDVDRHEKNLEKWHKQGITVYPYACCACAADLYDEWPFFEAEWYCAYGSSFVGYKRWGDDALYSMRSVCVGSTYADFLVHRLERLMQKRWADGLYTDIDNFVGCDNELHGCGYRDAFGRTGKTVPIYKHRDLSKRLYGICHKYGGLYLSHNHNWFIPPFHAFIDGWCPGEQLSVAVMGKHTFYMDGLTLDDWRAEYYSPATGVVTFMLAQWGRLSPKEDQKIRFPTENLIAMAALHNVPLWANFTNKDVVDEYWAVQKDFGVEDAEFCRYWQAPPVKTDTPDVKVSVYRKPDQALAVVVNFAGEDRPAALQLDRAAQRCSVRMPPGGSVTGSGKAWSVAVRRKNFALVLIEYD